MRRLLVAAALLACLPTAHAQDKGKTDFSINGEFRVRDTFEQNESGSSSLMPSHHNGIEQRLKVDMKFKANEKFWFNATLLQGAEWGQDNDGMMVGNRGAASDDSSPLGQNDQRNFMGVNQAYATWLMQDDLIAKIGQMNFAFGDGSVMSTNDWQAQPYAFDGVTVMHEREFGKFTFFAFKYRDFSDLVSANGGAQQTTTSDPQHDAYGLVFDLKTMPEWLKVLNAHIIQDTGDSVWNGTGGGSNTQAATTVQNLNELRYGVGAGAGWGAFDVNAGYEGVTGKTSAAGTGGVVANPPGDLSMNQMMYHAEVGFKLPNLMNSRFYFNYHSDSGTAKGDQGSKANTYDPYFYDRYNGSGMMQLVGWGNLTAMSLGWTAKPTDTTSVGAAYWMFSKTNKDDTINPGVYGQYLFNYSPQNFSESSIGNELDVWAEHQYDGGLSTMARVGYFMPGGNLKDSAVNRGSAITQLMVQGKLTF